LVLLPALGESALDQHFSQQQVKTSFGSWPLFATSCLEVGRKKDDEEKVEILVVCGEAQKGEKRGGQYLQPNAQPFEC
jgi:hypothetical protein